MSTSGVKLDPTLVSGALTEAAPGIVDQYLGGIQETIINETSRAQDAEQDISNQVAGVRDFTDTDFTTKVDDRITGLTHINAKTYGALGDDTTDDWEAITAAITAAHTLGVQVVMLPEGGICRVSKPLELSSTATTATRRSITLVGPAVIKPTADFAGDAVVRHTQTAEQAQAGSFGYGCTLDTIEIDGSLCTATTVDGLRLDGVWQPHLTRVNIHHMSGHGWTSPADDTIDSNGDDSYAALTPYVADCTFSDNTGWGIYQSRFSATFTAVSTIVERNGAGGARITSPKVQLIGGAVSYNAAAGIRFTRADSAGGSQLSSCVVIGTELDRNADTNVWFEHAYNCRLETCRFITAETGENFDGGAMIGSMARFGGTEGMTAFGITIAQPYVRHSQQTTNPPLTLWEFTAEASSCNVLDQHELSGGTTARVTAPMAGSYNHVTQTGGVPAVSTSLPITSGFAQATRAAAFTITTVLADLVFDTESIDVASRYDPTTGIYACGADLGIYAVAGFITLDGTALTATDRRVDVHLRIDPGTGVFASSRIVSVPVRASNQDTMIPIDFTVPVAAADVQIKLAVTASTGTALKVGSQSSLLTFTKVC